METLGEDVERCHGELVECLNRGETDADGAISADYEYYARQLIRAIIAYIEGVTYSIKLWAILRCKQSGIEFSDHELYMAFEIDSELNDKGEVVERPARIRLANNVRYALRLHARARGVDDQLDPNADWWAALRNTIKVRDRLTHPRFPEDVEISGDEIVAALKAKAGFENALIPDRTNEA